MHNRQGYAADNPLRLRDFEWTGFWLFKDDEYCFFHYEEEYGCNGPSDELNDLAEKHGYTETDPYTGEELSKMKSKRFTKKK